MAAAAASVKCLTCAFRCDGVCDVERSRALHAARRCVTQRAPSDEELVGRHLEVATSAHESPHFAMLFERHFRYVVAAVCRFTGRFDIAQDLAQDVFVKALLHIRSFRRDARFTTWLYAIARNCCFDYAKACAARPREIGEGDVGAPPMVTNAALEALSVAEARRLVLRLMRDADLDDTERRVFLLHYAAGVPLGALTTRLALRNRSGAKAHIVSAKRKLRGAVRRWNSRSVSAVGVAHGRIR